jgi:hypothetical protein
MNIWRINLKSASRNNVNPRQFCLQNNIVGVGWRINEECKKLTWNEYHLEASKIYADKNWKIALNALKNRIKIDDLIWTRDNQNNYYLGRIIGDWKYQSEKENLDADVVNIRDCDWMKIGTVDSVPGKLINSFIPARTVQSVNSHSVKMYSQTIFNELKGEKIYQLDDISDANIFSLLTSDDCEDLIAMYLQLKENYYLIPSSCKRDLMRYEFELKNKETGKSAVVQVKNGYVNLNSDDYDNLDSEVYLFTTKGLYLGEEKANIHFIKPEKIVNFMHLNKEILPNKIKFWMKKLIM